MSHYIKKQLFVKYYHLHSWKGKEWEEERQISNEKDFFNIERDFL
jgi:hypothetical protein